MLAALINHLWQSTLFALAAGLLTLTVRRNGAGVRYGLWLAASLKFLIPFAVLAAAGGLAAERLHLSLPAPQSVKAMAIQAIAPVVEPFTPAPAVTLATPAPAAPPTTPKVVPQATLSAPHVQSAPFDPALILLILWALGLAAVLGVWTLRWSRIREALRAARPTPLPAPVPVLSTPFPIEPGVIGVRRPWVIVPEGIAEHLTPAEWRAVLDHELCHIRRRDNLTGAIHMVVQALFWFHPLVWWLGERLVAEREQACDEAVVGGGSDARTYAKTILKVCRLYVQQPLACAAGASGSSLVVRVEAILNAPPSAPLSGPKKALLLTASACALGAPVAAGLLASPQAQAVVARAAALTSQVIGAPSAGPGPAASPNQALADTLVVLARSKPLLRSALSIAGITSNPVRLTRDLAAPQFRPVSVPVSAPVGAPAPAVAPAVARLAEPVAPEQQALEFVRSYASFSPKRQRIARWASPLCIRITGLAADQEKAVRARVAEVAEAVGLPVEQQVTLAGTQHGCFGSGVNVEIGFTMDPQAALDDVARHHSGFLGEGESGAKPARTITQPIQAWYLMGTDADIPATDTVMGSAATPGFRNVMVIVDLRRAGTERLGVIADYVTMLVLSRPRSPDHCQALPSITDLFAGACPGRAAPTGLAPADAAYLTALYSGTTPSTAGQPRSSQFSLLWKDQQPLTTPAGSAGQAQLADRMASILAKARRTAEASGAGQASAQPQG